MTQPFTKEILNTLPIKEGNLFEDRFIERASDNIFNNLTIEEVINSLTRAKEGYIIKASNKYGRDLYNFYISYKGYEYGLGATIEDGYISVNSFLSIGQVNYGLNNKHMSNFTI